MDTPEGANAIAWDSCWVCHPCSLLKRAYKYGIEGNRGVNRGASQADVFSSRTLGSENAGSDRISPDRYRKERSFRATESRPVQRLGVAFWGRRNGTPQFRLAEAA